ncbi:MAG: ammonium transporter [Gammaproteobacteria bacterium]|nr:ammonium transporter [Gammaproteobacteria bacterium]
MPFKRALLASLFLLVAPGLADAAEATLNGADTAWIMASTALVLFMTLPGLALFYGGLVRTRNVLSVHMQCFAIGGIASIIWFASGYSMAFSEGSSFLGGLSRAMLAGIGEDTVSGTIPESLFVLFQMTFAVITPALIIGAFAERMRFAAVLLFSAIWLITVYVPVTHWVWGGGWLQQLGVLDFAGGIVVHITAGVAALVAALVIGPRKGFLTTPMPPHNLTMAVTGAGMLWVGWFGFNGGSALASDGNAAMAMLVTHLAAATGAVTWLAFEWIRFGKPTALGTITGMVAGLGTITPASGFVGPAAAVLIGFAAGAICFNAVQIVKQKLKIDDSLDVFPVHGVGGMLGTLLVGVFASTDLGLFSGQGFADGIESIAHQFGVQLLAVVVVTAYTALVTFGVLKAVDAMVGLRVSPEAETEGLDIVSHEERGYDL